MSVTPYVMVRSAKEFTVFLRDTFAVEVGPVIPLPADPERVVHAEARIGGGVLYFADSGAHGEQCLSTPDGPVHVQLWTTVPDPESVHAKAIAAGANSAMPVTAQPDGSRMGGFVDPFGTLWWVSSTEPA